MSKTKLKYVKYTKQELNKYVNDKNSCINLINSDLHIAFPPWGLANFRETVTNIISKDKVGKYDAKLNGIVLDVGKIKVFGTSYAVRHDDPDNHINLNADFYIFQPHLGATIEGVVKHISQGHVAVIIYRVFNVSIRFRKALNHSLRINQKITFKIKNFDLRDAMPYIEGELIEYEASTLSAVKRCIKFEDNDDLGNPNDSGISTEESVVKRESGKANVNAAKAKRKERRESTSSSESSASDSDAEQKKRVENKKLANPSSIKIKRERISEDDSSSNDSEPTVAKPLPTTSIKKEFRKAQNTSSSSNSSDEEERPVIGIRVKKEKDVSASSDERSNTQTGFAWKKPQEMKKVSSSQENKTKNSIKTEPLSDVESITSSQRKSSKRKRDVRFGEESENLLQKIVNKTEKPDSELDEKEIFSKFATKVKDEPKAKKKKLDSSQNLNDLSIAFQSPGMSSTLMPNAKTKNSKKKTPSDGNDIEKSSRKIKKNKKGSGSDSDTFSLRKVKTETVNERKKEKKPKNKARAEKNAEVSLKSLQDDIFNSFLN